MYVNSTTYSASFLQQDSYQNEVKQSVVNQISNLAHTFNKTLNAHCT